MSRRIYQLGEIAEIQTGPFGSQLHQSDYVFDGIPIITVEHLGENRITRQNLPLVGADDYERLSKYRLREGDVVFSRVGSVDRRSYVSSEEDGWMFSGRCLRVRANPNIAHGRFLSYYFGQESFKEMVRMVAVGATMPSINTTIMSELEINLPPLPEQKAIAEVLGSLDDKIELLHQQNKTLEKMAETLFIHIYESNDEVCKSGVIDDLVSIKSGTTPSTSKSEFWDGDISWTSPRDLSNFNGVFLFDTPRKITSLGLAQIGSGLLPIGSVLLSSRAPIGYLAITDKEMAINQGYVGMVCDKDIPNFFIHLWVKRNMDAIVSAANGSTFLEISKSVFKSLACKIPTKEQLKDLGDKVEPIYEKIRENQLQIGTAQIMRSSLLPKLMSGEVSI